MFALTFCELICEDRLWRLLANIRYVPVGVLHVPINIPALGMTTGEDNLDLDRELRAHGWSNTLSGLCGSIQVSMTLCRLLAPLTWLTRHRIT